MSSCYTQNVNVFRYDVMYSQVIGEYFIKLKCMRHAVLIKYSHWLNNCSL